MLSDQ